MKRMIETVLRWAGVVFGAVILVSCTITGAMVGAPNMAGASVGSALSALVGLVGGAAAGFLGGLLILGLFGGWLYTYLMLQSNLKTIQAELAELRAQVPAPEQAGGERQAPGDEQDW